MNIFFHVPEIDFIRLRHKLAVVIVSEGSVLRVPERPDSALLIQDHGELSSTRHLGLNY